MNPNRADHTKHTGYLVPECRDCNSPEAIAARRAARAADCQHEPTDDGTACRFCGILAEPGTISPDALALLAAYEAADHDGTRARVTFQRADIERRRAIARQHLTDDELATAAALAGIVADRDALPLNTASPAAWYAVGLGRIAGDTRQPGNNVGAFARLAEAIARQREAGDVWADIQHSRSDDPYRYAAHHDAYTERELLAGLTAADGRVWTTLPPLYRLPDLPADFDPADAQRRGY